MRIWHLDTVGSAEAVDGIATGLWPLATAQARQGATVTVFVRSAVTGRAPVPSVEVVPMSRELRRLRSSTPYAMLGDPPHVVHFHAGWVPYHAALATVLRRRHVPYVVTPHGAYGPAVRASRQTARRVWETAVEGPYLRGAAAVVSTVAGEQEQAEALAGRLERQVTIPFPIDTGEPADGGGSARTPDPGDPAPDTVVFLGRFDVFHKGLDRMVDLARSLPDVRFDAYGEGRRGDTALAALRLAAPANVRFLPPVFGPAKSSVLRRASLYLQPSRFDGFPLSVADALLHGVPCAVSDELAVAAELVGAGVGLAVPMGTAALAAAAVRAALDDVPGRQRLSALGPAYVRERFDADGAAASHLALYTEVIGARR